MSSESTKQGSEQTLQDELRALRDECDERYKAFDAGETKSEHYLIAAAYAWLSCELERLLAKQAPSTKGKADVFDFVGEKIATAFWETVQSLQGFKDEYRMAGESTLEEFWFRATGKHADIDEKLAEAPASQPAAAPADLKQFPSYERKPRHRREVATGLCKNCGHKITFCGRPFTAEIECTKCKYINEFQTSQQPIACRPKGEIKKPQGKEASK